MGFYFDYYLLGILLLPGIILAVYAQFKVSHTFSKYKEIPSETGKEAHEIARLFLDHAGLSDVKIIKIKGELSDYYNHREKTLALSESTYNSSSISALGVACHEVGHALQYKTRYLPIMIRNILVPFVNLVNSFIWIFLAIGFIIFYTTSSMTWLWIAVGIFALSTVLSILTLPIEYNASHRALQLLKDSTILDEEETAKAKEVLDSAALTYVAGLLVSILNLLRFVLAILIRTKDRD